MCMEDDHYFMEIIDATNMSAQDVADVGGSIYLIKYAIGKEATDIEARKYQRRALEHYERMGA